MFAVPGSEFSLPQSTPTKPPVRKLGRKPSRASSVCPQLVAAASSPRNSPAPTTPSSPWLEAPSSYELPVAEPISDRYFCNNLVLIMRQDDENALGKFQQHWLKHRVSIITFHFKQI